MQQSRIDNFWNVDENRSLSDQWRGFTKFTLSKETLPKGCTWSRERLTKTQTTTRPDHVWPEAWSRIGKAAHRETETRQCEKLRGIYFIDPDDEECTDIIKNARRKLEKQMDAAMPCKKRLDAASSRESGATLRKVTASDKIPKKTK